MSAGAETNDFDFYLLSSTVNDIRKKFWQMERKEEKFDVKLR